MSVLIRMPREATSPSTFYWTVNRSNRASMWSQATHCVWRSGERAIEARGAGRARNGHVVVPASGKSRDSCGDGRPRRVHGDTGGGQDDVATQIRVGEIHDR